MIPANWKKATIGELCQIVKGKSPTMKTKSGTYPLVTTGEEYKTADTYQLDTEAVCVPMISSFGHGKAGLKRVHYIKGKFALANILTALIVKEPRELSTKYLALYLQTFKDQLIVPLQTGAANMSLRPEKLAGVPVSFPSLKEQERIVKIIDETQAIKELRSQAKMRTEQFAPALFQEIFGNIVNNDKNWKQEKLGDVCEVQTGKLNANAAVENGKYPFFTCSKEIFNIDTFAFDCEAILLSGNNASGDFDVKRYKGKFNAYQRTYVITIKKEYTDVLNYQILQTTLENNLDSLKYQAIGGLTKYLTLGMITSIKIPFPPQTLQEDFAIQVDKIHALQERQIISESKIELLLQSMLTKAFEGVL